MTQNDSHLYKICPRCDFFCHINEPDGYCSKCGTKLITKCPQCENSIDNPYAKYCKFCGEALPGRIKKEEQEF